MREQRFARTRGAQKHDVALSEFNVVVIRLGAEADALVVVVYGNRKRALGGLLANDMLAQAIEKLMRRGQRGENLGRRRSALLVVVKRSLRNMAFVAVEVSVE